FGRLGKLVGDVGHVGWFTGQRCSEGVRGASNVTAVSNAARRVALRSAFSTAGPSVHVSSTVPSARPRSQPGDVATQYARKRARFAGTVPSGSKAPPEAGVQVGSCSCQRWGGRSSAPWGRCAD